MQMARLALHGKEECMAYVKVTEGPEWSKESDQGPYANWMLPAGIAADQVDWEATRHMLGDCVVERFHEIAAQSGSSGTWNPDQGTLEAEADDQAWAYDDWREQALEDVAEQWNAGVIAPVSRQPHVT